MTYFLCKIRVSVILLIYIFVGALVLSFGTLHVAAQPAPPEQYDPQKIAAERARQITRTQEEWRPRFAELNRKIESDPNDLKAIKERAQLYMGIGVDQKVIDDYSRIIALKPIDVDAYLIRAIFRVSLDQYDLALADYAQVLKFDPRNYDAYTQRAGIYLKRESYDQAIADLTSILKFKPDDE